MLTATGVDGASLAQATEGLDLLEIPAIPPAPTRTPRWLAATATCSTFAAGDDIAGLVESGDIVPILALCESA